MSETYHVRFEAVTTDAEHKVFVKAFQGKEDLGEYCVVREGGRTVIFERNCGVSRTDDAESAIPEILRENGMSVVFVYEIEQEFGDSWYGTLSKDEDEVFNVMEYLRRKAEQKSRKIRQNQAKAA